MFSRNIGFSCKIYDQTHLSAAAAASIFKPSRRRRSRETATLYRHEKSCDQFAWALVFINSGN